MFTLPDVRPELVMAHRSFFSAGCVKLRKLKGEGGRVSHLLCLKSVE
jgi:hypothetical protein